MKNNQYKSSDIKKCCENKLQIKFRCNKECNGWFELNNRKIIRITISKARKSVKPGTYTSMARELKLSVKEFDDLLDCLINKNDYEEIIRNKIKQE